MLIQLAAETEIENYMIIGPLDNVFLYQHFFMAYKKFLSSEYELFTKKK